MNIQTGNSPSYMSTLRQTLSVTDRPSFERPAPAADSVSLAGSKSDFDLGETLKWSALGVLPGVGAVSNFTAGMVTAISGETDKSNTAFLGMVSNAVGTGALITGLLIGSAPTSIVGAGLLVGSGVAAGYAVQ